MSSIDTETLRHLVSLAQGYTQSGGRYIDRRRVLAEAERALDAATTPASSLSPKLT